MKKVTRLLLVLVFVLLSLSLFCGNGIATEEAMASNESEYQLQDSVFVEYLQSVDQKNNCYSYAIGRRFGDNYLVDGEVYNSNPKYGAVGFFFNGNIGGSSSLGTLYNTIVRDFASLCYSNVTSYTSCPDLTTLQPQQELICVRLANDSNISGNKEYHFMWYNKEDGYWYHKPGTASGVLKYKYQPRNDLVWTNEWSATEGVEKAPSCIYDGDILYITYYSFYNRDNGRYEVDTYEELDKIRVRPQDNWFLTSSITIPSNRPWETVNTFSGVLDGNNKTISGYTYVDGLRTNIGFVGENKGEIRNLIFSNSIINITEQSQDQQINIGTIAGLNLNIIENCQVGTMRIYGEASVMSTVQANAGAIVGENLHDGLTGVGQIRNCSVLYFNASVMGNLGGIVGLNEAGMVSNCTVSVSNLGLFYGTVGGIVGYSRCKIRNDSEYEPTIKNCSVIDCDISCYNGYPDVFPEYYISGHYGYAGGLVGWEKGKVNGGNTGERLLDGCSVTYTDIKCNSNEVSSSTFFPEMGYLCGRGVSGMVYSATYANNSMTAYNLTAIQKQYIQSSAVGRFV